MLYMRFFHDCRLRAAVVLTALAFASGGNLAVAQAPPETKWPLSAVPELQSNPGAARTIYLNFANRGVNAPLGGRAYTIDQDRNTFTDTELADIRDIWKGVAEKYSPWDVNVVTYNTGIWPNLMTIDIGDTSYTYHGPGMWRGLAGDPAKIWPETLPLDIRFLGVAVIVAHEAGHNYGLYHQEFNSPSGHTFLIGGQSYLPGNNQIGPIMGHGFEPWNERTLWWNNNLKNQNGVLYSAKTLDLLTRLGFLDSRYQVHTPKDLDRLASLGYKTDDHGGTSTTATPFTVNGIALSGAGIITETTDADYFSFTTTAAGPCTFRGDVAFPDPMLDLKLELRNSMGEVLATADTPSLGETLSVGNLAAGTYYLAVESHGGYGDIGQYTLKGRLGSAPPVATPTSLSATRVEDNVVRLNWSDNTSEETGYIVERSNQGGPWRMIEMLEANTTEYYDRRAADGVHYAYQVRATSDVLLSDYTNAAGVDMPTLADLAQPTDFRAVYNALTNVVDLSWTDNATRDWGYLVERKVGDEPWEVIYYLYLYDNTSYQDTWPAEGQALYRVRALNDLGYSWPSAEVAVPEPGTIALLAAGVLAGLCLWLRRKK